MQQSVTFESPISSNRCGYTARVSHSSPACVRISHLKKKKCIYVCVCVCVLLLSQRVFVQLWQTESPVLCRSCWVYLHVSLRVKSLAQCCGNSEQERCTVLAVKSLSLCVYVLKGRPGASFCSLLSYHQCNSPSFLSPLSVGAFPSRRPFCK